MSEQNRCGCRCHVIAMANQFACAHRGNLLRAFGFAQDAKEQRAWGVDRMDPIAAVFSCQSCSGLHCEVFSGPPPVLPRWAPADPLPALPDEYDAD